MIAIHNDKLTKQIDLFGDRIDRHVTAVQGKLEAWLNSPNIKISESLMQLSIPQIKYLELLKKNLPLIVKGDNIILKKFELEFDAIISEAEKNDPTKNFTPFKNHLLDLMEYSNLRSHYTQKQNPLYVDFYQNFGIRACVYCNSQLTVVIEESDRILRARFQVDHFLDKASYPCFSISFFNLYPVCASCNNKKGNKSLRFELYSADKAKISSSEFQFSIDRRSLAKFRSSRNVQDLKIFFKDNSSGLNNLFSVEGIFKTQIDLAAEIVLRAEIYNESYKNTLRESFENLYGKSNKHNMINFNRMIIGNYVDQKDIHKRPMAKFTQDIARQLKLIPDI